MLPKPRSRNCSVGGRTWQTHERELLERHVDNDKWLEAVLPQCPGRSINALKCQMSRLRVDMGLADGREVDAGWMVNARQGTRMLGEATLRVGVWT